MKKNRILYILIILIMIIPIGSISYGQVLDIEKHWERTDLGYKKGCP